MIKKKINLDKEELINLYLVENKTVTEIAKIYNVGTATVNRFLKLYEIKKPKDLRLQAISNTKQSKTEEEKQLYSQHISEARKGKGLGIEPWNKGKKGLQVAWNKRLKMPPKFKEQVKQGIANMTEEEKEQQKINLSQALSGRIPVNKGIAMSEEQKQKLREAWPSFSEAKKREIIVQQYTTKKQNGTCSISKPEDRYYTYLIEKYGEEDVFRQYSEDPRYPFACDFYVKSIDTFIELNLSWTHGGHLFDINSEQDLQKLLFWQEKAKTSKYYENAIETWTLRDTLKHKIATDNKLNYICYYSEEELYAA